MIKTGLVKKFERENHVELPKDIDSEKMVIASVLNNPLFMFKLEYLKREMFYEDKHSVIYDIIDRLQKSGVENIDNSMIANEIENTKAFKERFKEIDNVRLYLNDLKADARIDLEGVEFFARKVVSSAFKRDSYIKLQNIGNTVLESKDDINSVNELIQTEVVKFADEYLVDDNIKSLGEVCDDIYERLEENQEIGASGLCMSFPGLSEYFYLEPGEVVCIGGRTGGYKTVFFMCEALHKARQGIPTVIIDTECATDLWVARALANISKVSIRKIKTGGMTVDELARYESAKRELKELPIYHMYKPTLDMNELYMLFKQMVITKGLGFIVVDYLKVTNTRGLDSNQYDELGNLAIELKTIAGTLNLPILTGGQLLPNTERLADSSKIERYISTLCIWTPKTAEEKASDGVEQGNFRMRITKNRNGRITEDDCYLNFVVNGDISSIYEAKHFEHRADDSMPY